MDNIQSYDDNTNFSKIRKTIVNITVIIFGLLIILIFMLLGLYYITPNNYLMVKLDNNKFKLENTTIYTLKPNSNLQLDLKNDSDKYLKFSEITNLVIKNSFKSQSINTDTDLIKSKNNTEIFIINNSDKEKKITIEFYSNY